MKCFVGLFSSILVMSGCALVAQPLNAGQAAKPHPADVRIDHDLVLDKLPLRELFLNLLGSAQLHGGFVEKAGCSSLPERSLRLKRGSTVRQAMDILVATNPGYRWELNDGIINLAPKEGVPLLHTRIARFRLNTTDQETFVVLGRMLNLPELRAKETALKLKPGMSGMGLFGGEEHPAPKMPVSVHVDVQNVSLQHALNEIIKKSSKEAWIYHETDCNGTKTFAIDLSAD